MLVRIGNTPRDYAWGSHTAIAELLGREPSGGPEAELWLGAHPGSPSAILAPETVGGAGDLAAWIHDDPVTALGEGISAAPRRGRHVAESDAVPLAEGDETESPDAWQPRLPFLLKILAAAEPLSLQAHPSPAQAAEGYAREDALGIPLDAGHRNYKDAYHKPELIYALSDTFDALCGFRDLGQAREVLRSLEERVDAHEAEAIENLQARLSAGGEDAATMLRDTVEWLLTGGEDVDALIAAIVSAAGGILGSSEVPNGPETGSSAPVQDHSPGADPVGSTDITLDAARVVRMLAEAYPSDPGIVLSVLLNHVTLERGEAIYLPAGNIHAYLGGVGVELMAASDNVLRGGLTGKHVDVPELVEVLDFAPVPVPYLPPESPAPGVQVFRPDVPDFALYRVAVDDGSSATPDAAGSAAIEITGPAIAICTDGAVTLAGSAGGDPTPLSRGDAVYLTPDEAHLTITGAGTVFLATTNATT